MRLGACGAYVLVVPALDPVQLRTLGTLIEKQFTTPQYYPLTTAALLAGCNQSTSRDPVTSYDEATMRAALDGLRRDHALVRVIHPSHGRSVDRWRHVLDEVLGLIDEEVALLGVLMLRGAQTVAELRSRTERMAAFEPPDTVEAILDRLASYPEPLARCVGRSPGQSQDRWLHLLGDGTEGAHQNEPVMDSRLPARGSMTGLEREGPAQERVDQLERRVTALEGELAELREQLGG